MLLVTYLYQSGLGYLDAFFETLNHQTYKNFRVLVFNDGVAGAQAYFEKLSFKTDIVPVSGSPTEIRFKSFASISRQAEEKIVFLDIDDQMSPNRMQVMHDLLEKHPVVCNDLALMQENGTIVQHHVWSGRLPNYFVFDSNYIRNINILGIGNAGLRRQVLETPLVFSNRPLVADWFIFYQLLSAASLQAVFTTDCETYYRQHDHNMAGIRQASPERLKRVIAVKKAHYHALGDAGYDMQAEESRLKAAETRLANYRLTENNPSSSFFWWEETEILTP